MARKIDRNFATWTAAKVLRAAKTIGQNPKLLLVKLRRSSESFELDLDAALGNDVETRPVGD